MADLIITIDGPAASGKSTVARLLARKLGADFLDTGAMYRAVTFAAMQAGVDLSDEEKLLDCLGAHTFQFSPRAGTMAVSVDGTDITERIRSPEVTANARFVASAPKVREKLVRMQRQFAAGRKRIVTEGRDQGTVAFADAGVKFYLTADPAERARRRQAELQARGGGESLERVQEAIEQRDDGDRSRTVGPLKQAEDAIVVDTTHLSIDQVVEKLLTLVTDRFTIINRKSTIEIPGFRPGWFWLARWMCRVFCMLFFRWRWYGIENIPKRGPFLVVSNHQSFLDPIFCGAPPKRHLCFLARDTLFTHWFFGRVIASVNAIPVKRDRGDLTAMKKVIGKLQEGRGVCLFPEGTRTSDGKILPFKAGLGLLCRRGNAAIVPVVIDGAFESWPRHRKIFSPGGAIIVHYGKAITAQQAAAMGDEKLAKLLTDTLRQMQTKSRIDQGKKPYDYYS